MEIGLFIVGGIFIAALMFIDYMVRSYKMARKDAKYWKERYDELHKEHFELITKFYNKKIIDK